MISLAIYNTGIRLYYVGAYIASFFSAKAKKWIEGRRKAQHKLSKYVWSAHGKKIWFHCASLGEFEQARPLLEKIKKLHPDHHIILSFFSPSGYEIRQSYNKADLVCYLPLDTATEARKFIDKMKPSLVIWVKYDYWYHMLHELHSRGIPVILISATYRPEHIFFKWYGGLHRSMLGFFTRIYVQNETSAALLQKIDIAAEVNKDTRFDRVMDVYEQHKALENVSAYKADKKILIAGSTWTKDADMLCEIINNSDLPTGYKYIIAPHDVTRESINYLTEKIKRKKVLLSRLTIQNADQYDVVLVDSVGLLSSLYYYGNIAYIGGGFDRSVHNILEAAVYGMPVIFGPHYHKSEEAKSMLSHHEWHAAYTVSNYSGLQEVLRSLLANNEQYLKQGSVKAREYVMDNVGGTDHIYSYIKDAGLL